MNIQDIISNLESQMDAIGDIVNIPSDKKLEVLRLLDEAVDNLVSLSDSGYGFDDDRSDDYYEDEDE